MFHIDLIASSKNPIWVACSLSRGSMVGRRHSHTVNHFAAFSSSTPKSKEEEKTAAGPDSNKLRESNSVLSAG